MCQFVKMMLFENEDKRWTCIQHVQSLYTQGYTVTAIKNKLRLSRSTFYADLERKTKQIDQASRAAGFTGSHSTLSTIIAEERRLAKAYIKKSYSFRQKIIQVIWDFENGEHLERFLQPHPNLLEAYPKIKELDELVQSFRNAKLIKNRSKPQESRDYFLFEKLKK